ncbi:MAG: single-stranded-DNA-specific exonuclease RecJ [Oscillospiraceae bacterium]|jgi:single-stranded-DNA-specific exonuclease|nr:single-stranded-DNA-specific exonuclease RecJ [Oscillospiraceae bacterium]
MRKWTLNKSGEADLPAFKTLGPLAAAALSARGIDDETKAREFFNADKLHDPFLLKGMDKATELIRTALSDGGKITVYGDYDCDGVTATVMLCGYLTALGGEIDSYIPTREEGYGLNAKAIEKIAKSGTKLIITVDNGVSAVNEARLIKENGINLIITDHHTPPETLPEAAAIINPKQSGDEYPFKSLAGCGVVLKLIAALENGDNSGVMEQYGDLAAIGTIGDIVPLVDENRHIVSAGLENIKYSENIGLYCLMKQSGIFDRAGGMDAVSAAYVICPRINAAGRFSDPAKAAELLLCEDEQTAYDRASELNELNAARAEIERGITAEIQERLSADPSPLSERVLVLTGEDWHRGIIGIISAKMASRFDKPCVVISASGGTAKGSCRGVNGFSVHGMLKFCGDLLTRFGGHASAGGFTILSENIGAFKARALDYAKRYHDVMPAAEIRADGQPAPSDITVENIEKLNALQPFGEGNPVPVFYLPECAVKRKRPLKNGKYTSFDIEYKGLELKILDFSGVFADFWYKAGDIIDLMVSLGINEYNGVTGISVKMVDMRLSGLNQERYFAAKGAYEKIARGEEIDRKLINRVIPDDAKMKKVYDIVKNAPCLEEVAQRALKADVNYCMLRIILDMFSEAGLIEFNRSTGGIGLRETGEKADLSQSATFLKLRALAARRL